MGRTPSLVELREAALDAGASEALRAAIAEGPVTEVYLRVALSTLAPFAAVQEVRLTATLDPDHGTIALVEAPRAGIFEPGLLKRLQLLVGVLRELDIRHLDFGEIVEPPAGFDPGGYAAEYGGLPGIANYLFYPAATRGDRHDHAHLSLEASSGWSPPAMALARRSSGAS